MDYVPGVDGKDDGQPRVLASFMTALMKGEPLVLVDGGEVYRTFCFVDDAVESVVRMIDRPEKSIGHAFNVGNPHNNIQIKELAALMIELYSGLTGKPLGTTRDVAGVDYYGKGYPPLSHSTSPHLPTSPLRGLPTFLIPGSACKCSTRRHHVPTGTRIPTFGSLRCVSSSRSSTGSRRRA